MNAPVIDAAANAAATNSPDFDAIKQRQRAAWASGDYARIGTTLQIVGEQLCETLDLPAGARVLDVAAGNGNAALAAARRGAHVLATDYVPELLVGAAARARADGVPLVTEIADAERLPYADGAFDAVLSTFGVMFAPNRVAAAGELLRVCRSGGYIGLANWTPSSFIGQLLRTIGRFVPPPAGIAPPTLWGDRARIDEMFAAQARTLRIVEREFVFRYRSTQAWLDEFRTYYGPVATAFSRLADAEAATLEAELRELARAHDTREGATFRVPSGYLEVVIERA